jgi:hypothetical protein
MSIMNLGRGNGNGDGKSKRVAPAPAPFSPRPVTVRSPDYKAEQLQLGNVTLEAVDRLTGMSADEIDRVAEQLLDGAEETAAILRDLARRVRENGVFANERLARFVRVANQCADIARSMQHCVERRNDEVPPEPKKGDARVERAVETVDDSPSLGVIEEEIKEEIKGVRNGAAP